MSVGWNAAGRLSWLTIFHLCFFIQCCPVAWSATGTITIDSPHDSFVVESGKNFTINGTFVMTEDSMPTGSIPDPDCPNGTGSLSPEYWDSNGGVGTYAELHYSIDGVYIGRLGSVYETVYYDALGDMMNFSVNIYSANLDPSITHEVTFYMRDVYAEYCYWISKRFYGEIFAITTLRFNIGCLDIDNDGYPDNSSCPIGSDCNDNDANIYPNAPEICGDLKDNNCNGQADESCKRDRCMELSM